VSRDDFVGFSSSHQNSSIWSFMAVSVCAHCFVFRGRFCVHFCSQQNLWIWSIYSFSLDDFCCLGTISWAFLVVIKTRWFGQSDHFRGRFLLCGDVFGHFWPFPCVMAHCFVVRGQYRGHPNSYQVSLIWSFLVIFVGYIALFLCPGTISWAFLAVIKTRRFSHFCPFQCTI